MNNILTINAGSSSLKCGLYRADQQKLDLLYTLSVTDVLKRPIFTVTDSAGNKRDSDTFNNSSLDNTQKHLSALKHIIKWLGQQAPDDPITAIAHRVVHGGVLFHQPQAITSSTLSQLKKLIPLAPLHQPYNVRLIETCSTLLPQTPQMACFDTMFHSQQEPLVTGYALPRKITQKGIKRYGFHGLSYEYISKRLNQQCQLKNKTIIAHLGAGASLCALLNGKSVATTMGFSAAEGLPMATRTGSIDPGVLLYLMQTEGMSVEQIEHLIYKESGWLGISGISDDMATLVRSDAPEAAEAIDHFCYRAGREIGSLAAALQGLDQIIFTGGVGEHNAIIRQKIIAHCHWLGAKLNPSMNDQGAEVISLANSKIDVRVMATDEEFVLATYCLDWLEAKVQ